MPKPDKSRVERMTKMEAEVVAWRQLVATQESVLAGELAELKVKGERVRQMLDARLAVEQAKRASPVAG